MKAQLALLLFRLAFAYLQKHPELLDKVLDELAKAIPGTLDDAAIAVLRKALDR